METLKVLNIDIQNITRQELLENLKEGVTRSFMMCIRSRNGWCVTVRLFDAYGLFDASKNTTLC